MHTFIVVTECARVFLENLKPSHCSIVRYRIRKILSKVALIRPAKMMSMLALAQYLPFYLLLNFKFDISNLIYEN
jgi:hypothetical protein